MANAEMDTIRRMLAERPRPTGLAERRLRLDGLGSQYATAPDVHVEREASSGFGAEWTWVPGADPARVIMFLHGGGYVSGSIASHRHMLSQAGREAGVRTFAVDYPLAPEHPFPAALDCAVAAYCFLLSEGYEPRHIAIAGESAGGGLAVAAMVRLRDEGKGLPGCAWCSSPWVDLANTGATMESKAAEDPLISKPYLTELAAMYVQGTDPSMPLVSPLYADLRGLPPMLIQAGSAETLLDDAVRLAGAASCAGVRVTLQVWPDMIHAWHLFYQQLADGRRALAEAGAYVRAGLR